MEPPVQDYQFSGALLSARAVEDPACSCKFINKHDASTLRTGEVVGRTFTCRAYEGLVHVRRPVDPPFQNPDPYVPAEYREGKAVGAYRAGTAPLFLPNSVSAYGPITDPDHADRACEWQSGRLENPGGGGGFRLPLGPGPRKGLRFEGAVRLDGPGLPPGIRSSDPGSRD